MLIQHALPTGNVVSGVTLVDTSFAPWPGYTFGHTPASSPELVAQSFNALAEALDWRRTSIVTVTQVHGATIEVVEDAPPQPTTQADAIITNRSGWLLGVKLADCCGVVIYDQAHHAIAAVHSGWRGTAQNIVAATIVAMQHQYGTRPMDLQVWLSPCASGLAYVVRNDVHAALPAYCTPLEGTTSQWLFDNHAALRAQLIEAGVPVQSIITDESCTMTDQRWHSHRRDGEQAGRMLAFIGLRPMVGK